MARNTRAAATDALAPMTPTAPDELAQAGLVVADDADDGLGEAGAEDIRIATKVWNMKGVGADGRKIPEDEFYDTIDQTTTPTLDAVLLYLHKTNLYSEYDNTEGKNRIVCRSFDRVTGTMENGTTRPCAGCPDDQWYTDGGKRRKHCGPVYNVAALDRTSQLPFWLRFKRTSLPVFKQHLQKHHLGRRVVGRDRRNYPLYAFGVTLRCRMSDDGKYALPVIERGPVLAQAEYDACEHAAATIKANLMQLIGQADATEAATPGPDTSFDYGANGGAAAAGGTGQDFVE